MFVSYAQNFEDVILWRALKHVQNGFYVDIGAQDPNIDSVSYAFYERGWRGVHVEPVAAYAAKLRAARPDETVIEAVVAAKAGRSAFFEVEGTGLSTGEPAIADAHRKEGRTIRKVKIARTRLSGILDGVRDRQVHWLKIDVEGMEASVIESWEPSKVRPWVVLVESTKPNSTESSHEEWEPSLLSRGYQFAYFDGLNRFYVSDAHPELLGSFGPGPNVFDEFALNGTVSAAKLISEQNAALESMRQEHARRLSELNKRLIAANAEAANERRQAAELTTAFKAMKRQHTKREADFMAGLEEQTTALEVFRQEHARQLSELNEALLATSAETARQRARLNAVLASTSWRVTRPMRAVREGVRYFSRGAYAWLTLKPGSRPRRIARRQTIILADSLAGMPQVKRLAKWVLAAFPQLRSRLQTIVRHERVKRISETPVAPSMHFLRSASRDPRRTPGYREDGAANSPQVAATPGERTFYVFVDHTVGCPVNTGVQRVARGLSNGLIELGDNVRFVKWDATAKQCVLINSAERVHFARWNGPNISPKEQDVYPHPDGPLLAVPLHMWAENNWLIVPEVTHITGHPQPVTLDLICWARSSGLMTGFIFYDSIPLRRDEFADMAPKHHQYMQQLRLADAVWPISRYCAGDLAAFWKEREFSTAKTMPSILPVHLPGESALVARVTAPKAGANLILCVGTIEPRKNQLMLIRAFKAFRRRNPRRKWKLVFVGNLHPFVADEFNASMDAMISHAGNATDEELARLYGSCAFTVFPSVEEGFGLPILESLWHGRPCICADFGAMGEVAEGGGCQNVDVRDESALSGAIEKLATDVGLLQRLTAAAVRRPLDFWSNYATAIRTSIDDMGGLRSLIGPIYYWVDSTINFPNNTGIQRVTRQLAKALIDAGLHLIPVKWIPTELRFGPVSPDELAHFARWNAPGINEWQHWVEPVIDGERGWFLMPELPLNLSPEAQGHLLEFVQKRALRTAAIFYDAIPWKMRAVYPSVFANAHQQYMRGLDNYDLVMPISDFCRNDLVKFFSNDLDKQRSLDHKVISVPLPGEFRQSPRITTLKERVGHNSVTILCVGTVEPRKNHETLLVAFQTASKRSRLPMKLILTGGSHSFEPALADRVRAVVAKNPNISWEENAEDTRLHELHLACDFTVYPSLEEGFGLPIVESLWYGKPCICADFGAMAEAAAGGGCLLVNVHSVDELANAIERLADDPALCNKLAREAVNRPVKSWRDYGAEVAARLAEASPMPVKATIELPPDEYRARARAMRLRPRPILTVCVTTYNRAAWLAASLENWNRLYPNPLAGVDFLVCDNTSTDATSDVVGPYLKRPDFAYRRNPANVGMLGNLRETAHHANGQYIWILGDDDILMRGAIERVLDAIEKNPNIALVYLNYSTTRIQDARAISDFDAFARAAIPIVPAEADLAGPIRNICARNENFFTAIYTLVLRRDHALNAYSQETSGRPFSTMLTCIPTTHYVLNHMMDEPGVWIGSPQVVINMNVSWMRYAPLWILERIPEVYEFAELKGVASAEIDRWRQHSLPGIIHYFREIYETDPANNAAYFSPARLVRRIKHLPEFATCRNELMAIYETARRDGHPAAMQPLSAIFPDDEQHPGVLAKPVKSPGKYRINRPHIRV